MKAFQINIYIAIVILAIFTLSGCKSKKTIESSGPLASKNQEQLIDDVLANQIQYKTISTKGSLEFKTGSSSTKLNTNYTIIKDQVLQASVKMPILATEAMRLIFTPDSVIIIDRLNRQYVAENITQFKSLMQFDFYNLQSLLTNSLFIPGEKEITRDNYKEFGQSVSNEAYILQTKEGNNVSYSFAIDANDRIISTLIYSKKNNATIQWTYRDFVSDNQQIYPQTMEAQLVLAKNRADIGITYSKLEFDKDVTIDKTISSKYKKVGIKELLGSYMKLK